MAQRVAVGFSEDSDTTEAFAAAGAQARAGLDGNADLVVVFASAPHLAEVDEAIARVHAELSPQALVGCGAGGIVAPGRELERGAGVVVWAASLGGAQVESHHLTGSPGTPADELDGLPGNLGGCDALLVLADPYSFAAGSLLERLNAEAPGTPALGGLASAAVGGTARLFVDDLVRPGGAALVSLRGTQILPCVSQGAMPVGPEIAITEAEANVISELAFKPAAGRLREIVANLPPEEREQAAHGGMLVGVTIDENLPEHERGDYLVRPIIGADRESGAIAIGERIRVGQTIRLHIRDSESADADLREALAAQAQALGPAGAAGALLFTCNGRGAGMFGVGDHDANAIDDALGVPVGGLFCAGEIGPVSGRNFLHGFTATAAVFGA